MGEQMYSVRAVPVNGHDYRARAGMFWGKSAVKVAVVDKVGEAVPGVIQITPAQYAEMVEDPQIFIGAVGDPGADAGELMLAKAKIIQLTEELAVARRDLASAIEDHKAGSLAMIAEAEKTGAKVSGLESDLAGLRAQITPKAKAR